MVIITVRRVGDEDVVPLPDHLGAAGYAAGARVVIQSTPGGDLLIVPEARWRERIQAIGRRVIGDHREALDLLAAYDRGEAVLVDGELRRAPAADGEG